MPASPSDPLKDIVARKAKGRNDEVVALKGELQAHKAEINRLANLAQKHRSQESVIVDAVTVLLEGEAKMRLPAPLSFKKGPKEEEIAVLHVSDTQIGKVTATYNSQVADDRIQLLAEKTILITNLRRASARIRKLILLLGGDMVEGNTIFAHQAWCVDTSVLRQAILNAPRYIARMVHKLAPHFEEIEIRCVRGNHGRPGFKGGGDHPETNWDTVSYHVLKLMLLGPDGTNTPRLSMHIPETFYDVSYAFDWGLLMVHGDQIRGGFAGFPWYGTAKKAWGWIDSIPKPWDYLLFGHFHTYASAVLNHRTFLANGTTESDNEYAQEQLSACGYPSQRLCYFNAEHGLIADNQIFLDQARRPKRLVR